MHKIINKYIIGVLGFYIFWIGIMPHAITGIVNVVCKNINHNTRYTINVENFKTRLSVLPTISFKADKIVFGFDDKSFETKLDDFNLQCRILPLLSGRFHINYIVIGNVELNKTLEKNLSLDKDFFNKLEKAKYCIDKVEVSKFNSNFYKKEINKPIIFSGEEFVFKKKSDVLVFKIKSDLNIDTQVSVINLNFNLPKNNDIKKTIFEVEISNLNISPLKDYFKHYLPTNLKNLNGIINAKANKGELITELNNFSIIMNDKAKSIIFPEILLIHSAFNIKKQFIEMKNVEIKSKNIDITFNGKINNYLSRALSLFDFKMQINRAKIEDIIKLLPSIQLEELNIYELKKNNLQGDCIGNFTVKGTLPEPSINGDVYITNAVLNNTIPNTNKGSTIKLNFVGKHMNFDAVIPIGNLEKVYVKGMQELYNIKYADLTVKSTSSIDLHVVQSVLLPLHKILNFMIGPVSVLELSGQGNIDIIAKGNRKNPHMWGVINFKNAGLKFIDVPKLNIANINSVVTFSDQNIKYSANSGLVDGKTFLINGESTILGKFKYNIVSHAQETKFLYEVIKNSTLISEFDKYLPKFENIKGLANLDLNIYGNVKDFKDYKINKNVFANGSINLQNNEFVIQNIPIKSINSAVNFDKDFVNFNANATIDNLPLYIDTKIKNNLANIQLEIPKLNPNFLIADLKTRAMNYFPYISLNGSYNGEVDNINFDKLNIQAKILGSPQESKVKFNSNGQINIENSRIIIKDVNGYIETPENKFVVNLKTNDAFTNKSMTNGVINIKTPDVSLLNEFLANEIVATYLKNIFKDIQLKKGNINLNCRIINNRINLNTDLSGLSFMYLPQDLVFNIINGSLNLQNNILKLNKINCLADNMPILLDGEIKDPFDKKIFNLYLNSKPQQEFIDKYINKNQIYPIKIKGDIVYWVKLKGILSNYDLKIRIDMSKNSSIYHFGATVGDNENAISISQESRIINNNIMKLKEFSYDKLIDSQNGKKTELNLLKAHGGIEFLPEDLIFRDLFIKTNHPTDARIFNIIFRKPNIKQGQFTSDLRLNGKLSDPVILGDFHIFETNIPFLDIMMKNIEFVFKDKIVELKSKGDILGNEVVLKGILQNKLKTPYNIENATLYTNELNINKIIDKVKIVEVDNSSSLKSFEKFDLNDVVFKNFILKADKIILRNIDATNFVANTAFNEKGVFDVNDFTFDIAQGSLNGKYSYNLNTNDMVLNLNAKNIDANNIMLALFDLDNQILGDMTGVVDLACNGKDFNHCMETLNGNTIFTVKNGRMPKLGSLEYLLKAGNLVKGGITGISINNVIDLITPLKTGYFSDINGAVRIEDGIARNVEIITKGEDLNLFISGIYNFASSNAEMQVFGLLNRKISTMFGPIGNMSLNTLFNIIPGIDLSKDSTIINNINKIPGIELSDKMFRKFIAEIKGNINGDDYVTSFKWIN